jgi:hypothetical protein
MPATLIEWTQYLMMVAQLGILVVTLLAGIKGLRKGAKALLNG